MNRLLSIPLFLILITSCATAPKQRIDNIPMYGQPETERPEFLRDADKDFISKVTKEIPDRNKASQIWWKQGEKFIAQGNLDHAMRRYNQSWLLDPGNYQPYWGFARVSLEKGYVVKAINFLTKAKELVDDPYQEVAVLSDLGVAYNEMAKIYPNKKQHYFDLANQHFKSSTELDPNYGNSWKQWAFSLYDQQRFDDAMEKVQKGKQSESIIPISFPEEFLSDLKSKTLNH